MASAVMKKYSALMIVYKELQSAHAEVQAELQEFKETTHAAALAEADGLRAELHTLRGRYEELVIEKDRSEVRAVDELQRQIERGEQKSEASALAWKEREEEVRRTLSQTLKTLKEEHATQLRQQKDEFAERAARQQVLVMKLQTEARRIRTEQTEIETSIKDRHTGEMAALKASYDDRLADIADERDELESANTRMSAMLAGLEERYEYVTAELERAHKTIADRDTTHALALKQHLDVQQQHDLAHQQQAAELRRTLYLKTNVPKGVKATQTDAVKPPKMIDREVFAEPLMCSIGICAVPRVYNAGTNTVNQQPAAAHTPPAGTALDDAAAAARAAAQGTLPSLASLLAGGGLARPGGDDGPAALQQHQPFPHPRHLSVSVSPQGGGADADLEAEAATISELTTSRSPSPQCDRGGMGARGSSADPGAEAGGTTPRRRVGEDAWRGSMSISPHPHHALSLSPDVLDRHLRAVAHQLPPPQTHPLPSSPQPPYRDTLEAPVPASNQPAVHGGGVVLKPHDTASPRHVSPPAVYTPRPPPDHAGAAGPASEPCAGASAPPVSLSEHIVQQHAQHGVLGRKLLEEGPGHAQQRGRIWEAVVEVEQEASLSPAGWALGVGDAAAVGDSWGHITADPPLSRTQPRPNYAALRELEQAYQRIDVDERGRDVVDASISPPRALGALGALNPEARELIAAASPLRGRGPLTGLGSAHRVVGREHGYGPEVSSFAESHDPMLSPQRRPHDNVASVSPPRRRPRTPDAAALSERRARSRSARVSRHREQSPPHPSSDMQVVTTRHSTPPQLHRPRGHSHVHSHSPGDPSAPAAVFNRILQAAGGDAETAAELPRSRTRTTTPPAQVQLTPRTREGRGRSRSAGAAAGGGGDGSDANGNGIGVWTTDNLIDFFAPESAPKPSPVVEELLPPTPPGTMGYFIPSPARQEVAVSPAPQYAMEALGMASPPPIEDEASHPQPHPHDPHDIQVGTAAANILGSPPRQRGGGGELRTPGGGAHTPRAVSMGASSASGAAAAAGHFPPRASSVATTRSVATTTTTTGAFGVHHPVTTIPATPPPPMTYVGEEVNPPAPPDGEPLEYTIAEHPGAQLAWPIGALCKTSSGIAGRIKARSGRGFIVETDEATLTGAYVPFGDAKILTPPPVAGGDSPASGVGSVADRHTPERGRSIGGSGSGKVVRSRHYPTSLHPGHYYQAANRLTMTYTPKKYTLPKLAGC